jgi:hypothetical protein
MDTYATQNGGAGTVITNNEIHDIGYSGEPTSAGNCLWTDTTIDISVIGNTIYNCSSNGIFSEKDQNQTFQYNIIWNAGKGNDTAGISIAAGGGFASKHNTFYNNTVCNNGGWWAIAIGWEDTDSGTSMSGNVLMNNIFQGPGSSGDPLYVDSHSNTSSSASFSHNNFGEATGSCFFNYGGCYGSYSQFDAAYGAATYSVSGSPNFVDPPTDFALQSTSPDLARGIYIAGVSTTTSPNIGAH